MKKIAFILAMAFMSQCSFGQGIEFKEGNWNDIVALAKKEHKLIFMDIYTTWCGPCKMMDKNIFPQKAVGDLHNANFINYKIDAEKGEGLAIAAKYSVNAYPTNLFINPDNEELVYKAIGYVETDKFLERGNDALAEYKDPLKWDDYVAKYKSGNYDKTFLVNYMAKAKRKDKNYDDAINSFVAKYTKKNISDEDLQTLAKYTETYDNNAVDIIHANFKRAVPGGQSENNYWEMITYNTITKAAAEKNERLVTLIETKTKQYNLPTTITDKYSIKKNYYREIKDKAKMDAVSEEEANYFMGLSKAAILDADTKGAIKSKEQILSQLKAQKVPESEYQSSIDETMAHYPQYAKPASFEVANDLNNVSWAVVESKTTDKTKLSKAIVWSKKSLDLTEGTDNWAMYADTYAHLLFMQGNKKEAIALEEKAVEKMKVSNPDEAGNLQQSLDEMRK
jgi:thiol-disulfide isomerase/thioredoxin